MFSLSELSASRRWASTTAMLAVLALTAAAPPPVAAARAGAGPAVLSLAEPVSTAARVDWARAQAVLFWASSGAGILARFHAGASAGQCTDYAAARRPDIVARVDQSVFASRRLLDPLAFIYVTVDWNAKAWTADATSAGIPTGSTPAPGAVMVLQPGAHGAGTVGHVAVVDSVARSGAFTVSQMHAPRVGVVTTQRFGAKAARAIRRDPRVRFIYR